MTNVVLWDFDGVICDSMKIKSDGFRKLFDGFNRKLVDDFIEFHLQNGGMSRFDKIRYFYDKLIEQKIDGKKIDDLAKQYGIIIKKKLFNRNNIIKDSLYYIENNYKKYNFHIVSGAEHNELNALCQFLEIDKYFISIDGSPIKKDVLIKNLLKKYNYKTNEIIFIGDSINDYNASRINGIEFFGYNNEKLKKYNYISNMKLFLIGK